MGGTPTRFQRGSQARLQCLGWLLALWAALGSSTPANAVLVPVDLFSPGDALATRDTETGLDWLDLTLTLGHSFDDVAGGYGGWAAGGWRPATVHDVCHLINDHAGAALDPCPNLEVRILDPNPAIPALIDLLGATLSYETDLRLGTFEQAEAALGYFLVTDVEVGLGGVGNPALAYDFYGHRNKMLALAGYGYGPPDTHDPESGLFLVRAVPEPSTILSLSLGLVALCSIGRRSRKALRPRGGTFEHAARVRERALAARWPKPPASRGTASSSSR